MKRAAIAKITRLVAEEVPFEHIEAEIDSMDLPEEESAVLWLFAWAGASPSEVAAELGRVTCNLC